MLRALVAGAGRLAKGLAEGLGAFALGDRIAGVAQCHVFDSWGGPILVLGLVQAAFVFGVIAS